MTAKYIPPVWFFTLISENALDGIRERGFGSFPLLSRGIRS